MLNRIVRNIQCNYINNGINQPFRFSLIICVFFTLTMKDCHCFSVTDYTISYVARAEFPSVAPVAKLLVPEPTPVCKDL